MPGHDVGLQRAAVLGAIACLSACAGTAARDSGGQPAPAGRRSWGAPPLALPAPADATPRGHAVGMRLAATDERARRTALRLLRALLDDDAGAVTQLLGDPVSRLPSDRFRSRDEASRRCRRAFAALHLPPGITLDEVAATDRIAVNAAGPDGAAASDHTLLVSLPSPHGRPALPCVSQLRIHAGARPRVTAIRD